MAMFGNWETFAEWKKEVKKLGKECGAYIDESSICPNVKFSWGNYQIIAYLHSDVLKPTILMCIGKKSEWLQSDPKEMLDIIRNWFAD